MRALLLGSAVAALLSCSRKEDAPLASARVVVTRADLVGGQRALGDIGDVLLESVGGGTIFEVANGSCREVDIGPLPVPEAQPVPEALADQLGLAALLACRRWRA